MRALFRKYILWQFRQPIGDSLPCSQAAYKQSREPKAKLDTTTSHCSAMGVVKSGHLCQMGHLHTEFYLIVVMADRLDGTSTTESILAQYIS